MFVPQALAESHETAGGRNALKFGKYLTFKYLDEALTPFIASIAQDT
jgi:hypothetical protein